MALTVYSTHQMLSAVRHIPRPSSFWLNLAFRNTVTFDTEWIDFDRISKGRRVAPFVAPTAQGKPMITTGFSVSRFKPAYVKPLMPFDWNRVLTRTVGEPYTGNLTPEQRRSLIITDMLTEQRDMILRRLELMAAEAIMDGQVVVSGDDYPSQTVSFGRDVNQTVVLTGTDLWTDTVNSDPYQDFENWSIQMSRKAGYAATDWILGVNAWKALSEHPKTEKLLRTDLRSGDVTLNLGVGNIPDDGAIVQLKGTVGAGVRIWTYSDVYEDDDGNMVEVMDPDVVIGINPRGVQGHRCFGAIMDPDAGFRPAEMWPSNWRQRNPSAEFVMTESAPLMVPKEPNATFKVTVV